MLERVCVIFDLFPINNRVKYVLSVCHGCDAFERMELSAPKSKLRYPQTGNRTSLFLRSSRIPTATSIRGISVCDSSLLVNEIICMIVCFFGAMVPCISRKLT